MKADDDDDDDDDAHYTLVARASGFNPVSSSLAYARSRQRLQVWGVLVELDSRVRVVQLSGDFFF